MHARVVLGVGKGVLFREAPSFQGGVLIERFHCKCCQCVCVLMCMM